MAFRLNVSVYSQYSIKEGETALVLFINRMDVEPEGPNTGDDSHIALWVALDIVSMLGLAYILFISKKKKAEA